MAPALTGRPARTASSWLRATLLTLLGVAVGIIGSRYLLVGSALSPLPWGIVAGLIGNTSRSRRSTISAAASYGFASRPAS